MRRGPRIVATDDAVVITAIGGKLGKGQDENLFAWHSTDRGASWSGPVQVNDVAASAREGLHGMAASRPMASSIASGTIPAPPRWNSTAPSPPTTAVPGRPSHLVYRSPDGSICPCCHPSAAFAGDGSLYVMWRNDLGESRDMYLARSGDSGVSFDPAVKLGRKTWVFDKCPMDGGTLTVRGLNSVDTVWMRAQQVFAASPNGPERLLGPGVQPWAAPGDQGLHVVWLTRRPGDLQYLAPGDSIPQRLAKDANDPVIASGGKSAPVVAAWESTADDRRGIVVQLLEPSRD